MKKGKKLKRWGSLALAFATVLSGITVSAPLTASADEFTGGSLGTVSELTQSSDAKNVVNITFTGAGGGTVQGRITFLEDGVFRYNVDPAGEFSEYAKVRNGYPETAKIQAQPDDSERYTKPDAQVTSDSEKFTITCGSTTIELYRDTAMMTVKSDGKTVMEEAAPLEISSSGTTQTLVMHEGTNYNSGLREEFFGGGTQNGRFVHTGEVINIENESNWVDGGVSSPNPFYYTTNGYGVLRNTWMDGSYDFGATDGTVRTTHNENEYDAYIFVSSGTDGSSVSTDLLDGYYTVTGNPVLLPSYAFYLGHLNAYNRDAWSSTKDIGSDWTIKGNDPYDSEGTTTYENGGTGFEISENQQGESLNGHGPSDYHDNIPAGVTYPDAFSAQTVLEEYLEYDIPIGFFLPNDGYGAGYGQNGYNMTGGVNPDGTSTQARLDAVAANVDNLEEFADFAAGLGVATGLWTQSNLEPDSNSGTYWHTLRDFNAEVNAGVTTLKTDVAWVGYGYSFQLSGVKQAYDIVTENQSTRPNIISLDGWAGSQRYNSVWTGDQTGGNWEYIRFHIPTFIGQSLSGNPNIGSDMDGIWGGNPIIATRDYQWKSFAPQMLDMDGWGAYAKGPYVHGDPYTGVSRMYLKMKAMMMPYIYTNAYAAANMDTGNDDTGLPMMRAMFLEFPEESYAYTEAGSQYQYMWGENLLVAPIYQETQNDATRMGNDIRNGIYLPGGEDQIWIDYFTGDQYRGGQVLNGYDAPIWKIPLFVKNGAIIPMYAEHNVTYPNADKGVDKTQRIIEFWPDGESDFSAIEDDGTYIKNDLETVGGYGELNTIDYGEHVTTKYTSNVNNGTATLTAEKSTGSYTGYDENKNTTFVVNVSQKPTSVAAYNGDTGLTMTEVQNKADFDIQVPEAGQFIYFYDESPEIETFASDEEVIIAKMVADVEVSPKLYVKFAKTDTQANAQKLVIKGFENTGDLNSTDLNADLTAPNLSEDEAARTPTSITLTWGKVDGATGYEILVDGTIDEDGNVTSGMINSVAGGADATSFTHTDLRYSTPHTYYIRSVNEAGHSAWSEVLETETADDPFRLSPDVTEDQITWEGEIYGNHNPILAFDETFQSGDGGFHSNGNSIGQALTVDYENAYIFDYIEYYPRDDAGNGTVTQMRVETSLDGVNWVQHGDQEDADGNKYFQMEQNKTTKRLELSDPNTRSDSIGARYIRLTPLASVGNFFSASEIKVYTIDGRSGSADSPFRVGNISSIGLSEPTRDTFVLMYQKQSSAHGSYKDNDWVGEIQNQYADINFNGISDVWDYAFTAFYADGGTTRTGSVSGDILLQTDKTSVSEGEAFTINVIALDVENLNAYGSIINYDPNKLTYVSTKYVGTGAMYTQGMTGNIDNGDDTAYINHNAINMGDQPLVSGSKILATITMKAKTDITLNGVTDTESDDFIIDLSTVTLMGPDFSVKDSVAVTDVTIPENIPEGKIDNQWIASASAATTGPDGDGDDIWNSLDGNTVTYTNNDYPNSAKPQQYDFELKAAAPINKIRICPRITTAGSVGSGAPNVVSVLVSTDGQDYTEVVTEKAIDPNIADFTDITFNSVQARYIRLILNSEHATCVSTGEVELYSGTDNPLTAIGPAENASRQIHVGYVGDIYAVTTPADYPNQYFTATSADPSIASVIALIDEAGDPVYKVVGMSAGSTTITLTSAANSEIVGTYGITVEEGPDKTDLEEAVANTIAGAPSIYTKDSYSAYQAAREAAAAVLKDPNATRAQVEQATDALLAAHEALTVDALGSEYELNTTKVVASGSALYSDSNEYSRMFDDNLSTYWESPYSGENAELPQDIILTLADTYSLEQVSFTSHTIHNGGVTQYSIAVSTDNETWVPVASGTVDANEYRQGQNVRVDARFAPADARYVKFTVEGAVGRVESEDNKYGRIAEMDLYGTTKADKTDLDALIAEVSELDQNDYTEATWAALEEALEAASTVSADRSATTAEVTNAYGALCTAKKDLAKVPGTEPQDPVQALREELAGMISEWSGLTQGYYTDETWKAFDDQLKAAIDLLNGQPTEEELRNMITDLEAAHTALTVDYRAALQDLVDSLSNMSQGSYTDVSWNAFQAQLEAARALLEDENATDEQLMQMQAQLEAAIGNLATNPGGTGDAGTESGGDGADGSDKDKAVDTGDTASIASILAVLALSGGAVIILAGRKKRR